MANVRLAARATEQLGMPAGAPDRPTYGAIYDQTPELTYMPDVHGMLEANGIPENAGGPLPFSLEWYAEAPKRAKDRAKRKLELIAQRNELRTDWATTMCNDLSTWTQRFDIIAAEKEPSHLAELFVRTVTERPFDRQEINLLSKHSVAAGKKLDELRVFFEQGRDRCRVASEAIEAKEVREAAEEEERVRLEEQEKRRKAAAQLELKKSMEAATGQKQELTEDEQALLDEEEEQNAASPLVRGGAARELPPLVNPPAPPTPSRPQCCRLPHGKLLPPGVPPDGAGASLALDT